MKIDSFVLGSRTRVGRVLAGVVSAGVLLWSGAALAVSPDVVTVPWRGTLDLQHETYDGKQIHLKGVAHNVAVGATATWDPGDGSAPIAVVPNPVGGFDFDLGVTHTYPASAPGTPYTATLEVCNNGGGAGTECASDTYRVVVRTRTLDAEIHIAIDEGLWYLHRRQTRNAGATDGNWTSNNATANTASAVQSFQINNHFETDPTNQDPYADTVARGLKYMFSTLSSVAIGAQPAGNPDSNGNGIGIQANLGSRPIYVGGQVMDAIVTTKTPGTLTTTGPNGAALPANIGGRTYGDIVQDMVDMYAWGQFDTAANRGGWRYSWNTGPDNSACQWAGIGILAARDLFGATVPAFVYSENLIWLDFSQTPAPPANATGYGYTTRGSGQGLSPSGLVQLVMDGIPKTDAARWVSVEQTLANNWNAWYRDTTNYYSLFALAKAMRLSLPSPTIIMGTGASAIDWFKADCANPAACNAASDKWGVARTIIRDQNANGQFTGSNWTTGDLHHAWGVIILTGTLRLEPVAVAQASPNPGADGVPVNFDGSASFHQDPARTIVLYEWDFDNDNVVDATGVNASHAFSCPTLPTPCDFPVTLTVTDDGTPTPLVDADTIIVTISNPPHPPTADAGGPYMACTNEQVTLDGTGSFDIDEALGDSITAYAWEIDFVQPLDFGDATGPTPTVSYANPGLKDIGLEVTDDSASVFGGPDLTDQDFTSITVRDCDCVQNLAARPKSGKIQLTWTIVSGSVDSYDIYRGTAGPWGPFSLIAAGHVSSYPTYLDTGLVNGTTYWYRIVPKDGNGVEVCGSDDVSATPRGRARP
jgi:hypothetical protein